jgi:hypothetical protein
VTLDPSLVEAARGIVWADGAIQGKAPVVLHATDQAILVALGYIFPFRGLPTTPWAWWVLSSSSYPVFTKQHSGSRQSEFVNHTPPLLFDSPRHLIGGRINGVGGELLRFSVPHSLAMLQTTRGEE